MKPFLDTNVLLYMLARDDPRQRIAQRVISDGGIISTQVLNEFANVAHRKLKLTWVEVGSALSALRSLLPAALPLTVSMHEAALSLAGRYRLSFYDALIIASALEARCTTLFSEDLQHRMAIGRHLTIINPFAAADPENERSKPPSEHDGGQKERPGDQDGERQAAAERGAELALTPLPGERDADRP